VLALETVPSLRARAAANASTPSGGMSASAALYRNSDGHFSNPPFSIVVPGDARAGRAAATASRRSPRASPRVCSSRICCASALRRRSFFSATACATSAAFPGRDLQSPLHPFPVTAANPPHAASTYRRRFAIGRQASAAAATLANAFSEANGVFSSGATDARDPVSTERKDAATIPGSSSPGALSITSAATESEKRAAAAGSGANPSLRLRTVVMDAPSGVSVSATNPVCACMMFPANTYPPLLNRCRIRGRSSSAHAGPSATGAETRDALFPSASSSAKIFRACATAPSAVAANASPSAGNSVAATGGVTHTTASYPSASLRYIFAYLRRCDGLHPNQPTSTGSAREPPPRGAAPPARASSTCGAIWRYVTALAGGSSGNSLANAAPPAADAPAEACVTVWTRRDRTATARSGDGRGRCGAARAPADDAGDARTRRSKQEVDISTARASSRRARKDMDDRAGSS
jgi:hypothetical protein